MGKHCKKVEAVENDAQMYCGECGELMDTDDLETHCAICNDELGEEIRYILKASIQKAACSDQTRPSVINVEAISEGKFCSEEHALEAAQYYLDDTYGPDLNLTFSNVIPTANCAKCGTEFETDNWHEALMMTIETGPISAPKVLGGVHLARICPTCAPLPVSAETLDNIVATYDQDSAIVRNLGLM